MKVRPIHRCARAETTIFHERYIEFWTCSWINLIIPNEKRIEGEKNICVNLRSVNLFQSISVQMCFYRIFIFSHQFLPLYAAGKRTGVPFSQYSNSSLYSCQRYFVAVLWYDVLWRCIFLCEEKVRQTMMYDKFGRLCFAMRYLLAMDKQYHMNVMNVDSVRKAMTAMTLPANVCGKNLSRQNAVFTKNSIAVRLAFLRINGGCSGRHTGCAPGFHRIKLNVFELYRIFPI